MTEIECQYEVRGDDEVADWLEANPYLVPLLREARGHVDQAFGSGIKIALEVIEDAEVEDWLQLWALIEEDDADRARRGLDRLEGWWIDAMPRAEGKLSFDIDCR